MISLRMFSATVYGVMSVALAAQPAPELTARELFYVPAATAPPAGGKKVVTQAKRPPAAKPSVPKPAAQPAVKPAEDAEVVTVNNPAYEGPRPLGLRYSVLRVESGDSREVAVDSTFRSGDSVGIAVQPNESAFLYVVARGSSGKWQVLFPNKDINEGDNWVESGRRYALPSNNLAWTFDEQKGAEKLFVVLARQEVADLEKLIYDLNQPAPVKPREAPSAAPAKPAVTPVPPPAARRDKPIMIANTSTIDDALVGRLRSQMLTRDLIVEKVSQREYALYAVEKSGKRDARLVVDVELKHE